NVAVNYDKRRDTLDLDSSYIATPATRLDFSGSLGTEIKLRLVSRDLNDFLPAMALASPTAPKTLAVALDNGNASFDGTITGKVENPTIAGHVAVTNFVYEKQRYDRLAADLHAQKSSLTVRNAVLAQGKMQAQANASLALKEWKPDPHGPLSADASL